MTQLGVGIVGCGWVAEEHIKAFEHDERSRVAALMSRRIESAELYRDRYSLDCAVDTDFEKMLERDDVDIRPDGFEIPLQIGQMHLHQLVQERVRASGLPGQHHHEVVHAVEELTAFQKIAAKEPDNRAVRAFAKPFRAGGERGWIRLRWPRR